MDTTALGSIWHSVWCFLSWESVAHVNTEESEDDKSNVYFNAADMKEYFPQKSEEILNM